MSKTDCYQHCKNHLHNKIYQLINNNIEKRKPAGMLYFIKAKFNYFSCRRYEKESWLFIRHFTAVFFHIIWTNYQGTTAIDIRSKPLNSCTSQGSETDKILNYIISRVNFLIRKSEMFFSRRDEKMNSIFIIYFSGSSSMNSSECSRTKLLFDTFFFFNI